MTAPSSWRHGSIVLGLALLSGCNGSTGPARDPRACQQTAEFGNDGCADLEGQVVGRCGHPLAGVVVGLREGAGGSPFHGPIAQTDTRGYFGLRLTRFSGPVLTPDTVSLWIGAAVVPPPPPQMAAFAGDSVLVRLTVAPIGQVPAPAVVTISLPIP